MKKIIRPEGPAKKIILLRYCPKKIFRPRPRSQAPPRISNGPCLTGGDVVGIRPTGNEKAWKKALVEDQVDVRSYNVRTEDGPIFRRNRRHLRFSREPFYQDPATEAFEPADTRQQPHVHTEPNQPQNSEPAISEVPQQPEQPVLSPVPVQPPQPAVQSPKSVVKTRSDRVIKKPQRFSD